MKNNKNILLVILYFILVSLFVSSCNVTDPTEGLEVRLNTFSRETLVSSYIYDANTLQTVTQTVTIKFVGANSSLIVDETNESQTEFTTKNGIFIFGIKDGTEIELDAANYDSELAELKLSKKGTQTKNLFMVNPANLPSNSENETFDGGNTNSSGTLQNTVTHTTTMGTNININAGTVMTTKSGSPLSGDLTMSVSVIPLTSANSYNVSQEILTSGSELVNPMMKFNFTINDPSGNSADNFSTPISFSLNISDDLEVPYVNGETIFVWRKSNSSGLYKKVGEASFSSSLSLSKQLRITFGSLNGSTNSAGDLILGNATQTCTAAINVANLPNDFSSDLQFFNDNGVLVATSNTGSFEIEIPNDGLQISSVRINADLDDPYNTGIELTNNLSIVCGTNDVELNFPTQLMSVRCDIIGICTAKDPAVVVNPNISFSYKKTDASTWQSQNLVNGIAVVTGLEIGANYEITATYRGNTGTAVFKIVSQQEIEIVELSNPEDLLSSGVNSSTTPPTLFMEIDIGNECD